MWPYRKQLSINKNNKNDSNNNNSSSCNSSPKFRRTSSNLDSNPPSFKNIDSLFTHDDKNVSNLNTIAEENENRSTPAAVVPAMEVKRTSVFHRVHLANRLDSGYSSRPKSEPPGIPMESNKSTDAVKSEKLEKPRKSLPKIAVPGGEKRVVVYMTSIRAVRQTFEECRTVRSILQGFRVPIDERDLSMDSAYYEEIRKILAQMGQAGSDGKRVILPKVFIGGRYIGGADDVVELHEIGELKKFVSGLPAVTPGVCDSCGGFRFILCEECYGSHKVPLDDDNGFRTCTECNENGLIRCPSCFFE